MKINIGTIYKTKITKMGDGVYELALVGIPSPKSLVIKKYHITLSQEMTEIQIKDLKALLSKQKDINLVANALAEYLETPFSIAEEILRRRSDSITVDSNHTIKSQIAVSEFDSFKIAIESKGLLSKTLASQGINPNDLIKIVSIEPKYLESAFEFIASEIIKKDFDTNLIRLADTITLVLTGKLSPENKGLVPIGTFDIDKRPPMNPAIFLASLESEAAIDEEMATMSDTWKLQAKYIEFLTRIFEKNGIDINKIALPSFDCLWESDNAKKSIGFRNYLAKNPTLVHEYLLSLNTKEIIAFAKEIFCFFKEFQNTCINGLVFDTQTDRHFDLTAQMLVAAITAFITTRYTFTIENEDLKLTSLSGETKSHHLSSKPETHKKRMLLALQNIVRSDKTPERIRRATEGLIKILKKEQE